MNSIAVLHPKCANKSATALAKALNATAINPFENPNKDYTNFDIVINYGCNRNIKAKKLINQTKAIATCIDKRATLLAIQEAGLPAVPYATSKRDIPYNWKQVVVRKLINSNANKGMKIYKNTDAIPDAPLYTEYFEHKKEFRVTVLYGYACACYEKEHINEEWHLLLKNYDYLQPIKLACIKAADALKIDYVGFDVLVNKKNEFVILEANTAPILTEEMIEAFKEATNV